MTKRENDIIASMIDRLAQWATPAELMRIEIQMREAWGGKEVYVRKSGTLHLPRKHDAP